MLYRMQGFEIAASFSEGSQGRRDHRLIDKDGRNQLGSEAWGLGFKAYEMLDVDSQKLVCEDGYVSFVRGWIRLIDERLLEMQAMLDMSQVSVIDAVSGVAVRDLGLSGRDWPSKLQLLVQIMKSPPTVSPVDVIQPFVGILVIAAFYRLDDAVIASHLDDYEGISDCMMDASWFIDQVESGHRIATAAASELKLLDSRRASDRAKIGHAASTKRKARDFVMECWQGWRNEPGQYSNASAFARAMLDKFPDELKSEVVITRWVRQWDKGNK